MKSPVLFVVAVLFALSPGASANAAPGLALGPCADPSLPKDARCGTYEVFENRAAKKGRKIPLRVVVLPALGPDRLPDPVVWFGGGPGESSVEAGVYMAQVLASLRQRRDFLLVDLRGTGPGPLDCPELHASKGIRELQGFLDHFVPADAVRACRERVGRIADLTHYTTDNAMDDVDEVRAALGYPKVNVMGGSYGTRSVQVYLRRHPDRVRTAVLSGALRPDDRAPLFFARGAQKALDALIAECAGDAACARAFPRVREEVEAVLARAGREPVRVRLADPRTGKPYEIRLSRDGVAQTLRYMLYRPSAAAELPLRVHLAAQGDWKPLAETGVSFAPDMSEFDNAYFLGVTCSEDVPFIRDEEIPAAVAGTFLGDFRIREQRAACAQWPAKKVAASFQEPVVSDVPALVIAGERDPATPAEDGQEVARHLRHGRFVLIPGAGHGTDGLKGMECIYGLMAKLVEEGSADRLDTSCLAEIERPAFAFNLGDPEVAVGRADLEPLAAKPLTLGPCNDPELPPNARCGTYEVFENRAARKGRKIPLRIEVLPALGPDRAPDPVVWFSGGPGESAVLDGFDLAKGLAPLWQRHDFLLVELRGTGPGGPLDCPELHASRGLPEIQAFLDHYVPAEGVRACRKRLEKVADLTQYTTDNAMDDVDEVRAALGYPKLNILGASYGTRSVQVYLRRHPETVRTAILDGVLKPGVRVPLFFARGAQKALDGLIAECAEDAACVQAFPRLREEVGEVLARAGREPVRVRLTDAKTGKPYEIRLARSGVAQTLRYMLYTPSTAAELPLRVHLAAQGDWKPLAETAVGFAPVMSSFDNAYFLGVLCSEDVPFIRDEEIPAAVAGTFLGDFRIRKQRAACAEWKARKVPESFLEPVVSDVPALVISGERDPATPAADGEEVARHLRRSKYVLIHDAAHGTEGFKGQECIDNLYVKLVEDGSAEHLDTSCVAKMERPAFALNLGGDAPRLTLTPCNDPQLPTDARCGTWEVFENRAAKSGRKIPLRVVVVPALGKDRLPDPVVFFNGGPGNSSVRVARGLAQTLAPLRQRRDILLVDFRGTGGSAPLECPELLGSGSVQEWLDSYRPADKVRACHDRLSRAVDLAQYTTDNAVDDVDEVRAALGYPKLNLAGSSYGSRAVLVYLRRHPESVRTAILDGVAQTHDRGPLFFARTAQRALDALIAECAEEAACARAFPHLKDEVAAVFERAGREPVTVGLVDPKTGERRQVRLSRSGVAQVVRYMLYESDWALEIPRLLHQAAQGDWKPLAERAVAMAGLGQRQAPDGYYLSITCSEDVPFIRDEEIAPAVAGTFLGDFRIRQQREACAAWSVPKVPASYLEPVTSDVPALVVNHGRDPVTPASDGEEAARTLRHARTILVPYAGHSTDGLEGAECLDALWVKLIEDGSADRLDTSCVAKIRRPAFPVK